jgi:hypothetical protein
MIMYFFLDIASDILIEMACTLRDVELTNKKSLITIMLITYLGII